MRKNRNIDIDPYLPQLQTDYQKDIFEKVVGILQSRGFTIASDEDLRILFKERIKAQVHEGITTLSIDGVEFCAYSMLHAQAEGKMIKKSYKFTEI